MPHRPRPTDRFAIVATTANQWRLKEGAKNDRLKKALRLLRGGGGGVGAMHRARQAGKAVQ